MTDDSGFVWSMNWESWLDPKNSLITAETGLALIRSWGISVSISLRLIRSLMAVSMRTRPIRYWFSSNSPTTAHAPVAEVIDVVDLLVPSVVLQVDQVLTAAGCPPDAVGSVVCESERSEVRQRRTQLVVDLETPHLREVVALGVEEQVVEEIRRRVVGRRVTGAQAPVDLDDRLLLGGDLVHEQRVTEAVPDDDVIEVEQRKLVDTVVAKHRRGGPR